MKQKILLLDRDGIILQEPKDYQVDALSKFRLVPGVISALKKIKEKTNLPFWLVTNQDGLGTDIFPEDTFWPYQQLMLDILASEGIEFDKIFIDKTFPEENKPTRKPGVEMLREYLNPETSAYDFQNSYMVGDRLTDLEFAKNLGAKGILLLTQTFNFSEQEIAQRTPVFKAKNWQEISEFIIQQTTSRVSLIERNTKESKIKISLNLDGTGKACISTGLGFFDHMLEQIAKHGGMDLELETKGDLHIDEHHTIEDTGLALGKAFFEALGEKRGITRYGFLLPMDESLAQVAIDFSGRSFLVWEAEFKREKVGDLPCELFSHFFKSFCDEAKANLNIKATGENEHHKIESIFKAFAKVLGQAVRKTGSEEIPSTKGIL